MKRVKVKERDAGACKSVRVAPDVFMPANQTHVTMAPAFAAALKRAVSKPTYKAWKVEARDEEDRAVIVHAASRLQAKRCGASELDTAEPYVLLRARRAPEFDGLGGSDLMRAMLEHDWYWECLGCYRVVSSSVEGHVIRDGDVYCSTACCLKWLRKARAERIRKAAALRQATEKWPDAEIVSAYENVAGDWLLAIRHPGQEYPTMVLLDAAREREIA